MWRDGGSHRAGSRKVYSRHAVDGMARREVYDSGRSDREQARGGANQHRDNYPGDLDQFAE